MLSTLLTALHLDDPASLKRALATGLASCVSVAVVFGSPWLVAHGIPAPSEAMQATLVAAIVAKVVPYVLQSAARSRANDAAAAVPDREAALKSLADAAGVEAPKS